MKSLGTILLLVAGMYSAPGQGVLSFNNNILQPPPDRLVRDSCGAPLVGTNYVAQLWYGATADNLFPHTDIARFRAPTTTQPGTWSGGTRTLIGVGGVGTTVFLQVKVWDSNYGSTFDSARAAGSPSGESEVFPYSQAVSSPPQATDTQMKNFRGFSLTGDCSLRIREADGYMEVTFDGQQQERLESSEDLRAWQPLGLQRSPFHDSTIVPARFYRINNGGYYSDNVVGFYRLELCRGFSLIANQLDASNNTISNLFKAPPESTHVYKFDPVFDVYTRMSFIDGVWEGNDLDLTLNPGEGAFVSSPQNFVQTFLGEVRRPSSLPIQIPAGYSILSSPIPQAAPLDQPAPSGLGFPVREGDAVFQWDCATRNYIFNLFIENSWQGDNEGLPPTLSVGEAFFLYRPGQPGTWNRTFAVGP